MSSRFPMRMGEFTPLSSFAGGVTIGIAAALLLVANGRIAGISGILGGLLERVPGEVGWRAAFLAGLVGGGLVLRAVAPEAIGSPTVSSEVFVVAGLLVGFGTRLGNGCTSGHGVCGVARLSPRSLVATMTFMVAGMVVTFVVRHLVGGGE